jgi:hypothetical protein
MLHFTFESGKQKLIEKTQKDLGTTLHMNQDGVSRLEKKADLLLSMLSKYITTC